MAGVRGRASALWRFVTNTLQRPSAWLLAGRAVQLVNSVLVSGVVVRRFGLKMVGTYALGYILVAFLPHILSLGLNSELPRTKRPIPQLLYIAIVIQLTMGLLTLPALYLYSALMANSSSERSVVFVVALFGSFTGMFNVALTLNILLRHFKSAFYAPLIETLAIFIGAYLSRTGLQMACFVLAGKMLTLLVAWPSLRIQRVAIRETFPTIKQGAKYLFLDLVSTFSEQLIPFLLGISAPREQLGLFRLCYQISSAAETPGWSYVQSKYPELTRGLRSVNKRIARHARTIGVAASALCVAGSIPVAFVVFKTPVVAAMMLVLGGALPWRYVSFVSDQRLRASGSISPILKLALLRVLFCAVMLELTIRTSAVWAGVLTSGTASVLFGVLYARTADAWDRHRAGQQLSVPSPA